MDYNRSRNGFIDSGDILTTINANTEIIPTEPYSAPVRNHQCYKLTFMNKQACHFLINNKTRCYRDAGEGWESNENDVQIESFIIEEIGIQYKFTGAY